MKKGAAMTDLVMIAVVIDPTWGEDRAIVETSTNPDLGNPGGQQTILIKITGARRQVEDELRILEAYNSHPVVSVMATAKLRELLAS